jgi:hypothetical protein
VNAILQHKRHDFWRACGHHLLDRDAEGQLRVSDEFLRAYLARPELVPPPGACPAERQLHDALLANPRQLMSPSQIAALTDEDARENWSLMIAWRDQLLKHRTLEAAYLDIVKRGHKFPHLFIHQLAQIILRNVLDGCDDVFVLRAAELLFRPQRLTLLDGSLVAADEENAPGRENPVSPLVTLLGLSAPAEIDVLNDANAATYWDRSDQFDMALDLTAGRRGVAALGEVLARWVWHLLAIDVAIEPLVVLRDASFTWYVGLDAEATSIGDALWRGCELDEADRARVVGLYRLTFIDPSDAIEGGEPVYLILAMAADNSLWLKPQNLVTGLPLKQREIAS